MASRLYTKYVLIFFVLTTVLFVSVLLFNYLVDPGNQFAHGTVIEQKMVNALLKGESVSVEANYNERLLQKIMIEKLSYSPQIFVLGSSHIMPLTHAMLSNKSFFNASVSSAGIQDDVALYYLLQRRGYQPKIVIICLDPWLVSKDPPEKLWKTEYIDDYDKGRSLILGKKNEPQAFIHIASFFEKYSQLLSSDYLEASINNFISQLKQNNINQNNQFRVLTGHSKICGNCFVRQPDGSRLPTPNEEAITSEKANQYVIDNINNWGAFWTQSQLGPHATLLFESFVQYLIQHKIKVVFYFPPLEPMEYSQVVKKNKNYKMVLLARNYFLKLAKKQRIEVIGSYNPKKLHLDTSNFIDNWHLKKGAVKKLFIQLK